MGKMRKLIMLIISAVCIGAISAVSFAAWTGGNRDLNSSVTLGTIQYLELDADAGIQITVLDGKADAPLFPVDQGVGARFLKVAVVVTAASVDYRVGVMQHQGTEDEPYEFKLAKDSGLYFVRRGTFLSHFPNEKIVYPARGNRDAIEDLQGNKITAKTTETAQIAASGTAIFGESLGGADSAVTHYFYLFLDSNDSTDMNKTLKIDIVLLPAE